jgi:3-deoxy-7-phosphoheptulonate synthase
MPADSIDPRAAARAWSPSSWKNFPALQQPTYPDAASLERALVELAELPPLVTSWEVIALNDQLADAALGRRFVLQAGDCAERISECSSQRITNKLKILLQMSLLLVQGAACPVIRIGRFAGQYAKPRSSDLEERDGVRLPSYRGDLINQKAA